VSEAAFLREPVETVEERKMRGKSIQWVVVLAALALAGSALADADHLLITEFCVTPTAGEFVEIHNPTDLTIDLTDYYLADYIYNNDNDYVNIVDSTDTGHYQDFLAQFPAGASIGADEYQTIAVDDTNFYDTYGVWPTYELNPSGEDDGDAIPDMLNGGVGGIGSSPGITNAGESLLLFYWDGVYDLVYDVDYVVWGDKAEAIYKTTELCKDSKTDGDEDPTCYLNDTPVENQEVVNADGGDDQPHTYGMTAQREDPDNEASETSTGGNGITGHDETSEDLSVAGGSWTVDGTATPGGPPPTDNPPEIWGTKHSPCIPESDDWVTVSAYVKDDVGVASVILFFSYDSGASYDSTAMTASPGDSLYEVDLSPQPDPTKCFYYIRAIDTYPHETFDPSGAPYYYYGYAVGFDEIYDIQYVENPGEDDGSTYEGYPVNVTGVVTTASGVFSTYWFVIEDPLGGPWSGIHVYDWSESVVVEEGDSVSVGGMVDEYYYVTEIILHNPACVTVHSTGAALPAYEVLTCGQFPMGDANMSEQYESVLIEFDDVSVADTMDAYAEWKITDNGIDTSLVDDLSGYTFVPKMDSVKLNPVEDWWWWGQFVHKVRGIGDYSYYNYKLQPRYDADILYVDVDLTPDATVVPQGGYLEYDVDLCNYNDVSVTLDYWSDAYLFNGKFYNGNPAISREGIPFPAGACRQGHVKHKIPNKAPTKTYTLCGRIGDFPSETLWNQDCFSFTVISGMMHSDSGWEGEFIGEGSFDKAF
jgi:hypothetical protein